MVISNAAENMQENGLKVEFYPEVEMSVTEERPIEVLERVRSIYRDRGRLSDH